MRSGRHLASLTLRLRSRDKRAGTSSLHSWQLRAAASPRPVPARCSCSSHTAHGEGRRTSRGREACGSGRHPHPLPQWAARSQGSLLQGSAAVITSGVNHQRLQACTRLLTFSTAQSCSAPSPAWGRVPGQWRSWQQHPGARSKPEAPTSPILHRGETLLGFGAL